MGRRPGGCCGYLGDSTTSFSGNCQPRYAIGPVRRGRLSLRNWFCLRHPYRVRPCGLNTERIAVISSTTRPPTQWGSVPSNSRESALEAAVAAIWATVGVSISKMVAAFHVPDDEGRLTAHLPVRHRLIT